jgi:hypothetical protein
MSGTLIIFARVPSAQAHSYVKLREWIMVLCVRAMELKTAPRFTYMLIDIPTTSTRKFPACCSIKTNSFPDPEMTAGKYEWLLSVECRGRQTQQRDHHRTLSRSSTC